MKIVIGIIIAFLIILTYSCCVIQKDGEQIEIYREIYRRCQDYSFTTEEAREQAELNLIEQYIEEGILPQKCINSYKIWRGVNYTSI